jgi:16S rRNA A1518/A1519 N6-dimethyltransferase RsmA/KsgA/DIM1 with predicted DNA glycosylase/AP lyase activity
MGNLRNQTVIEVGPGPGGLTQSLLGRQAKRVIIIEKDRRFLPVLEQLREVVGPDRLHIVMDDVLNVREEDLLSIAGVEKADWNAPAGPGR